MKTVYKSRDNRYTTEFEWTNVKELFKQIAKFQEVFEDNNECPHCKVPSLLNVRTHEGNDFFEKRCPKCDKTFSYGQKKIGQELFPHTQKGWAKWTRQENPEDSPFENSAPQGGGSKTAVTVTKPAVAKAGKK